MEKDLTKGPILKSLLLFSLPMIAGNLLQQIYNITDTIIVGRFLGSNALAAVGSTYTLITFLTSIMIGLCMGCGALFSMYYGAKRLGKMKEAMWTSFWMILAVTLLLYLIVFSQTDLILRLLQSPTEIYDMMRSYSRIIFIGLGFTFLYNYFAFLLRSIGNSLLPLSLLGISSALNIFLDLFCVITLNMGVEGAALATVLSQAIAGLGITFIVLLKYPQFFPSKEERSFQKASLKEVGSYALFTCLQQSVMNFGILMIQGLVNSFGTTIMAAFAAAVKIDTLAYMPAQEFGNAFSLFISQNHGAGERERVKKGIRISVKLSILFCLIISAVVWIFAKSFMQIFVDGSESSILTAGVSYLRIEGSFYFGIGCLFLLYGLFRAIEKPAVSLLLTIISLGTRVLLSYALAPSTPLGVLAIWWSIPIGWILADLAGLFLYLRIQKKAKSKP